MSKPVVASYCTTFLKPEMLHIYRQITGLREFRPVVLTQRREGGSEFPFGEIVVMPKPATHWLRRFWVKQIRHRPIQIYRSEARRLADELRRMLHAWRKDVDAQMPTPNPNYKPDAAPGKKKRAQRDTP